MMRVAIPLLCGACVAPALGQNDLRGVLPADCVLVAGVEAPARALAALGSAVGGVPTDLPEDVRGLVAAGLLGVRAWLGGSPTEYCERMAAGGAAFGIRHDGARWRPLLVMRPGDLEGAQHWLGRFGGVRLRVAGGLLLAASSDADCAALVERAAALGEVPAQDAADVAAVRASIDLAALRRHLPPRGTAHLGGGQRFLFAPLVDPFYRAGSLVVELRGGEALQLTARLDAAVGAPWRGLLAAAGGTRQLLSLPQNGLMQIAIDRSLRELLGAPERFLDEAGQLDVQSFLSIADLFDGAATSFVDDLIGGLREPFVISLLDVEPVEGAASPIRLPGLVLTAGIADPGVTALLARASQVLATIVNGERRQNGKLPFVLRRVGGATGSGWTAEPPPWRGPGRPPVEDALSPTLIWNDTHAALASTLGAAETMLACAAAAAGTVAGDAVTVRGAALARLIAANRRVLELGRMLDESERPDEAARFFAILTAVGEAIRSLDLHVDYGADATTLTLDLERSR